MSDLDQRIASLSPEKREMLLRKLNKQQSVSSTQTAIPRRGETAEPLPLSFAQESLWLVDQIASGEAAYTLPCVWRLRGPLNLAALEQAIQELVNRHETLRTTFPAAGGRPTQKIAPTFQAPLTVMDMQGRSEKESSVQQYIDAEVARPFDLAEGPLLRVVLLRLAEQEHVLALIMHHIISDGWSAEILARELTALYQAFSDGQPSPLPELPIQYADFALWQREQLQGAQTERLLDYWKQRLAGAPGVLELPTDHPHPIVQTFNGAKATFPLPASLAKDLRALGQQEQTTLFMTLLATFHALLTRYTGSQDIVVGSPFANRSRTETEGLIGYLVNMLVLRADFSGNPSFRELLKHVRATTLEAYAHQDLPFEKLVEALQPERNTSYTPIFQAMFVMENPTRSVAGVAGLDWEWMDIANTGAKFDLALGFQDDAQHELSGFFEYNTDLFEAATIERMIGHLITLMTGMVANPDQSIATLPLLTQAEQQQMLVDWNATEAPYPQDQCFHQLFEAQVERTPDAAAVYFGGQRLTYRQLNERANQLAHYLQELGVGPEVTVGLYLKRSLDVLVAIFGIHKAGGAYVPMDPGYPAERVAYILEDSQTRLLVTQTDLLGNLTAYQEQIICLDRDWPTIAGQPQTNPTSGVKTDHLAYMIYTSGSTGKPKGVLITHRGLPNLAYGIQHFFHTGPTSRLLETASFSFDASIYELLSALPFGGTVYIATDDERLPGPSMLRLLREQSITHAVLMPSVLATLPPEELPAIEVLTAAAEACSADLVAKWVKPGRRFLNAYGPTETTIAATWAEAINNGQVPPIGRPYLNYQAYVLDAHRQPLPIGIPGELCLGGDGLARGYHHRPELTAEKFIQHPFSQKPGARIYRTGDLVRWRADGNLEFVGRIDHQVKIRGFRVELGEIEAALRQHPAVNEAVVIAREDTPGNKRLVAYVILHPEQSLSDKEMQTFLKVNLPEYMIPFACIALDALPLTTNGKIDQKALPAPEPGRVVETDAYVAPELMEHYQLLGIWEELLDARPIGIRDNFFLLGGHSLLAARLMARIEETFGKKISLATLFAGPTIEEITAALQQQEEPDGSRTPIITIQSSGSRRPFFFLHGFWEGGGFYCYHLARELGAGQPFYALQPYRLDGLAVPPGFEKMAAEHIESIRAIQPEGPYQVGGFCNGALMAAEITRQLRAQHQRVNLLALIDPTSPARLSQRLTRGTFQSIGRLLGATEEKRLEVYLRLRTFFAFARECARCLVFKKNREKWREIRRADGKMILPLPRLNWLAMPRARLRDDWPSVYNWKTPSHIPEVDAEGLTFFWASQASKERIWRNLAKAKGAQSYIFPGEHAVWLPDSTRVLAEQLGAHLREEETLPVSQEVVEVS